jgi:branched-chain amino acid transport system substrate-binding protein
MGENRSMRRTRTAVISAVAAVSVIGLAACSSGSSSPSKSSSSGSSSFSSPVNLGFLWEVQGESTVAINDFQNGATLAVSEINKAGGVGGHPVTYFRQPTSVLNMQSAQASFLTAVGNNPTMLIGPVVQGQVLALGPEIDRAGIPLLTAFGAAEAINYAAPGTSQWVWSAKAEVQQLAQFATQYLAQTLHYTNIGIMGTNEAFGNSGVATIKAELQKLGLQPFAVAQYSPTATDLTQQVLAMKGAQAVIDWGYPSTVAVQVNQFVQNGLDIPTIGSDAVTSAINGGLVKGVALSKVAVVESCDPNAPTTPRLTAFVKAYKDKYGTSPILSAVNAYDDVHIAIAAIEKANSTSPAAINKAMGEITYTGACATYHADPAHSMNHFASIVQYDSSGASHTVKTSELPPIPKAS